MRLLASSGEECLTKALLSDLASSSGLADGLEVYRLYLKSSMNLTLSHDTLAGLENSSLARFYNLDNPKLAPRYIDLLNHNNLARLEIALDKQIVLARPPENPGQHWQRIHDHRAGDRILPEERPPSTLFYALFRISKQWQLYSGHEEEFMLTAYAESFAVDWEKLGSRISKTTDCYRKKVEDALDLPPSAHEHSQECLTLVGLLTTKAFEHTPFTLATHTGSRATAKRSRLPRNQLYTVLARLGSGESATVLLLRADGSIVPALPDHAEEVLRPKYKSASSNPLPGSFPDLEKPSGRKRKLPKWTDRDHCGGCRDADDYEKNFHPSGGQRLFQYQPSTFDLMSMLGISSEENERLVRTASKRSCLYFDLESCTSKTKQQGGQEELSSNFAPLSGFAGKREVLAKQTTVLIGAVDGLDLEEGRRPVVLGCQPGRHDAMVSEFADLLLERRDAARRSKRELLSPLLDKLAAFKVDYMSFLTSEGFLDEPAPDDPEPPASDLEDCFLMDEDGEEEEVEDDEEEEEAKRRRKEELSRSERRRREAEKGWKSTVWGRLESNLTALVSCFTCFAFNGEG